MRSFHVLLLCHLAAGLLPQQDSSVAVDADGTVHGSIQTQQDSASAPPAAAPSSAPTAPRPSLMRREAAAAELAAEEADGDGKNASRAELRAELRADLEDASLADREGFHVRGLRKPPPFHQHPRVFFSREEIPEVRQRLLSTKVGREALKQLRIHSMLMHKGRHHLQRQPMSTRFFAHDSTRPKSRISNMGLWDTSAAYKALVAGDLSKSAHWRHKLGPTGSSVAMEAFLCHIETGVSQERKRDVAKAIATWGRWAVIEKKVGWIFGYQWALAYDLAHPWMTNTERAQARKAIVASLLYYSMMLTDKRFNGEYYGAGLEAEADTSNWATLDSFMPIMICAVEGEITKAADGVDWPRVERYFKGSMLSLDHFQRYGMWKTGAPYEGQGKNYMFAAHQIAFAKRGYNHFNYESAKNYGSKWLAHIVQPYGHSSFAYDVLGGSGAEPVKGGYNVITQDHIGLKFMYPSDPGVDFVFRNVVLTEARHKGSGKKFTYIDVGEGKFPARADKYNNLLMLAIFASDFKGDDSEKSRRDAMAGKLDYLDNEGGTLISRSDWSLEATTLQVHIRQDFGGHTHADRNSYSLSALGRIFIPIFSTGKGQAAYMQYPRYNSETLVDGLASKVCPQDGAKMRIPAKVAAWSPLQTATSFITGDATYSYSNEYVWNPYDAGKDMHLRSYLFLGEDATFNDFRRSNNKIKEAKVGNVAFWKYPHWASPGKLEGIQKKSYNPMREVFRTSGLVRGRKPYVLVFEDIRKDDAPHDFTWHFPIASDLEVRTKSHLPPYSNPHTDIVLAEPGGHRNLLVRILQARGKHGKGLLAYRDELINAYKEKRHRLVIQRLAVSAPEFVLLFFPFKTGEPLPHTAYRGNRRLTVRVGPQRDEYTFVKRTVKSSMSPPNSKTLQPADDKTFKEFFLHRNGKLLLDYRGRVEPMPFKSLWRCSCKVMWKAYGRLWHPKHEACDKDTKFDFDTCKPVPGRCNMRVFRSNGKQLGWGTCCNTKNPIERVIRTCPKLAKKKTSCNHEGCRWV